MSRKLHAAVAQLGPIHLADSRAAVVKRLSALLREAHGGGAKFVVFPELALTTFFPRYWMTDQAEIDRSSSMTCRARSPAVVQSGKELGFGFYLGYAELPGEGGRATTTAILVDRTGASSAATARSICRAIPASAAGAVPAPRALFRCRQWGSGLWRMRGAVMGMCICNDRRWPETYQGHGSTRG
jgi:predicted amidohydrolase